jgi:hypothetical protein
MKTVHDKLGLFVLTFVLLMSLPYPVLANIGNDWLGGYLRVDLAEVANSMDYRVWLMANHTPNTWDLTTSNTAAWLSVNAPDFFKWE